VRAHVLAPHTSHAGMPRVQRKIAHEDSSELRNAMLWVALLVLFMQRRKGRIPRGEIGVAFDLLDVKIVLVLGG
jgi:hypothetical protein